MAASNQTRAGELEAKEEEAARYRRAADEALGQLDWCVTYLHRIRKPAIAGALNKNCRFIRQQMTEPDD